MKRALVRTAIAVLLAGCASAPVGTAGSPERLIAREGTTWVRLDRAVCEGLASWKTGEAEIAGTRYRFCWRSLQQPLPHVLIQFEDGDSVRIPVEQFAVERDVPAESAPPRPGANPAGHRVTL